jgi:hypothetical protein
MVGARTWTALVGVLLSLAVSAALWYYFDALVGFLFVPFVPFLLRGRGDVDERPSLRRCPACDFRTRDPDFDYCPRDGTRLETGENAGTRTRAP